MTTKKAEVSEESSEDDRKEVYPTLSRLSSETDYRYSKDEKRYYLPGDFSIPKETFENLFDH